jgi:hypothetical protein
MTSLTKHRLLCAALLLSSLQFGFSQTPTSPTIFNFGPPVNPVWDISGTYQITNHLVGKTIRPQDIVFNGLALNVDAHGKVQGAGTILVSVGSDIVGGDYKVSGKMSGGNTKTRANFSVHFKGNGTVAGIITKCNITAKYNLTVNPAGLTLVGTSSGNASFSHLGSGKLQSNLVLPLPAGADGGWNVTLDIVQFGKKLSGTSVVLVDNTPTTTLSTKANGNIAKASTANVKLSGSGYSAGTQITMEFLPVLGATNLVASIKGKVLGQNVKN